MCLNHRRGHSQFGNDRGTRRHSLRSHEFRPIAVASRTWNEFEDRRTRCAQLCCAHNVDVSAISRFRIARVDLPLRNRRACRLYSRRQRHDFAPRHRIALSAFGGDRQRGRSGRLDGKSRGCAEDQ
jgi:hypothetical protein